MANKKGMKILRESTTYQLEQSYNTWANKYNITIISTSLTYVLGDFILSVVYQENY